MHERFMLYYIRVVGLSSTINDSLAICDLVTSRIGHLGNTGSLSHADLPNVNVNIYHYSILEK